MAAVRASGWPAPTKPLQATVAPSEIRRGRLGRGADAVVDRTQTYHPPLTWITWPVM